MEFYKIQYYFQTRTRVDHVPTWTMDEGHLGFPRAYMAGPAKSGAGTALLAYTATIEQMVSERFDGGEILLQAVRGEVSTTKSLREIVYGKLDEEYERRKKEEKAEGKRGWAAYRWQRDLLERMSVAIAKGNWALLDAHTPVRPFVAAA